MTKQKVLVSHTHRRVNACVPIPAKHPTACAAQLKDALATTTVSFEPIATAVRAPRRKRVVVSFPDATGLQKMSVELALGDWLVNWPGCRDAPRLNLTAANAVSPRVVLRTTSGACELSKGECRVTSTIEQRLSIEE
jgi:hypothetical protein